jgi:hypothetical protein
LVRKERKYGRLIKKSMDSEIISVTCKSLILISPATITHIIEPAFRKTIEIKTNENIGEIITAVEKLCLEDIKIKATDTFEGIGFLPLWVILFLVFGILLAVYHAIYCIISSLLNLKEKDDGLLKID